VTAGQAVLEQTTQVYVLFFQCALSVPPDDSYCIVADALLLIMSVFRC
jgi:hypothetical protein